MNPTLTTWLIALAVLIGTVLGAPVVSQVLRLVSVRLAAAADKLVSLVAQFGALAKRLVTREDSVSLTEGLGGVAGSSVLLAGAMVCAVTDLELAILTIGPLIDLEVSTFIGAQWLKKHLSLLTGFSVVAMAAIFMMAIFDLVCWSSLTPFAYIKSKDMRVVALVSAVVAFLGVVSLVAALALYRDSVLQIMESLDTDGPMIIYYSRFILVSLAVLLIVAAGVGVTGLEVVVAALVALLLGLLALGACVIYIGVLMVKLSADCIVEAVTALSQLFTNGPSTLASGITTLRNGVTGFARWVWNGLKKAVTP